MKLIDFGKIGEHFEKRLRYPSRRTRSLRTTIVTTVFEAIVRGFFLGVTLQDYLRGRSALSWIFPLTMAFTAALTTLQHMFVALRQCPRPAKTAGGEATLHDASA